MESIESSFGGFANGIRRAKGTRKVFLRRTEKTLSLTSNFACLFRLNRWVAVFAAIKLKFPKKGKKSMKIKTMRTLWSERRFSTLVQNRDIAKVPRSLLERLTDAVRYVA